MCDATQKNNDIEDLLVNAKGQKNINVKDCKKHKELLINILNEIEHINNVSEYDKLYVRLCHHYSAKNTSGEMAKKCELTILYKFLLINNEIEPSPKFEKYNVVKPNRGNSGVLVIAVMLSDKPNGQEFTCKWDCDYCPKEPNMPRSYISNEPAVARGVRNGFDPCRQFNERGTTHFLNGHTIDKIELLILGGTFNSYPKDYRKEFIKMLIYSANTFFQINKRPPFSLEEEVIINETARVRVIGITIETRPDCISGPFLKELRELEVTRIQMGVQHTDDDILSQNNRGHKVKHSIRGIQMAMNAGFKVDIHLMTNLPGSTAEKDRKMFNYVLSNPDIQGDQWKIYPTQVTPWTTIAIKYKAGEYVPYSADDMFEVIIEAKIKIWPWIRNNRIIRDFSSKDDLAGNIVPHMRQELHIELKKRGHQCHCIRCLEPRNDTSCIHLARLTTRCIQKQIDNDYGTTHMKTSNSIDYFISFESCSCDSCDLYYWHLIRGDKYFDGCPNRNKLYGFLRLRIMNCTDKTFPELCGRNIAFIRELHVYGKITAVGSSSTKDGIQHYNFGRRLISAAENIAKKHKCDRISIISGVGVRKYYEKFNYIKSDVGKYMIKDIDYTSSLKYSEYIIPSIICWISILIIIITSFLI